MYIISF